NYGVSDNQRQTKWRSKNINRHLSECFINSSKNNHITTISQSTFLHIVLLTEFIREQTNLVDQIVFFLIKQRFISMVRLTGTIAIAGQLRTLIRWKKSICGILKK
ncbi:hypothetical protein NQ318_012983, partial [Aromia moschata]